MINKKQVVLICISLILVLASLVCVINFLQKVFQEDSGDDIFGDADIVTFFLWAILVGIPVEILIFAGYKLVFSKTDQEDIKSYKFFVIVSLTTIVLYGVVAALETKVIDNVRNFTNPLFAVAVLGTCMCGFYLLSTGTGKETIE